MTLTVLLLIIFLAISFIVLATNYLQLHPFLALLLSCLIVGFLTGMEGQIIVKTASTGFGAILSGIGLIVALGTVIGVFIEKSGALDAISNFMLKLLGSDRTITAMGILGAVVSIPVFCDSAYIILSRLSYSLASRQKSSSASLSLALATGLYTSHTLIPPTPGPIAVAGNLGASNQIGMVILIGILISIPVLIVSTFLSKTLGKSLSIDISYNALDSPEKAELNVLWACAPILVPIILIAGSSIVSLLHWESDMIGFVGSPIIALLIGCFLAMIQVRKIIPLRKQGELFGTGIKQAGPIILITGAGGAFGSILKATPLTDLLTSEFSGGSLGMYSFMLIAFTLAAILKTAQGSSTTALVIGSAILAPFVTELRIESPLEFALLVSSFGAGAMVISHANDSYFWVVTQMSGFSMKQGYRSYSLITLAQGLTAIISILGIYFFVSLF